MIHTRTLDPNAATGDVTATIGDGEGYDVGDPSSATARVHVGETLVTVRLDAVSYTLDEGVGTTTDQIKLIVQTAPGVPIPIRRFPVSVRSGRDTAMSPNDYAPVSEELALPQASSDWAFTPGGDAFVAEVPVPVTIVDDDDVEGDEVLTLTLEMAPGMLRSSTMTSATPTVPADGRWLGPSGRATPRANAGSSTSSLRVVEAAALRSALMR